MIMAIFISSPAYYNRVLVHVLHPAATQAVQTFCRNSVPTATWQKVSYLSPRITLNVRIYVVVMLDFGNGLLAD